MDTLQQGVAELGITPSTPSLNSGYTRPKVSRCSNVSQDAEGKHDNCPNDGTLSCSGCHLVRYCSKKCQVSHRSKHKVDCQSSLSKDSWQPSWIREGRMPAFVGEGPVLQAFGNLGYLWGNTPAFDVLNIDQNEGQDHNAGFDLCFAASGDLRNIMCSINGLPNKYKGTCTTVLNDKNYNVVARNITMLLLAAQLPPPDAAEIILHVWYSARLTHGMLAAIDKYMKEPIAELVAKIKGKAGNVLYSKKWAYGAAEVTVRLYKEHWTTLLQILETKHDVVVTEKERLKVVLAPTRVDYRDRELYLIPGSGRMCSTRFRETGVLAPFGACLDQFDRSNPLLFNENTSAWLQKDSASPLEGWPMHSILTPTNLQRTAKGDLNGLLYFHVRAEIERFCRQVQSASFKTSFTHYCVDAAVLPQILNVPVPCLGFDRIEVSNIVDQAYLGLNKTLSTFGPLIKAPSVNPHAALITLFLNACEIADRMMGNRDAIAENHAQIDRIMKYIHIDPRDLRRALASPTSPEWLKLMSARDLVRDYDKIFDWYMMHMNFTSAANAAGLVMREPNTIIDPWPMRLKKVPGEQGAAEEFNKLLASSSSGAERYVEWVRKK